MNNFYDTAETFYSKAKDLASADETNWNMAIIAMFYASAHYIHSFLVEKAGYTEKDLSTNFDHKKRTQLCNSLADLQPIEADYQLLNSRAWNSRYNPRFIKKINNPSKKTTIEGLLHDMEAVKTHIDSKLT